MQGGTHRSKRTGRGMRNRSKSKWGEGACLGAGTRLRRTVLDHIVLAIMAHRCLLGLFTSVLVHSAPKGGVFLTGVECVNEVMRKVGGNAIVLASPGSHAPAVSGVCQKSARNRGRVDGGHVPTSLFNVLVWFAWQIINYLVFRHWNVHITMTVRPLQ
jgi:hypothetical protein